MTVFHGTLVQAGQPEVLNEANGQQKAQWTLGAKYAQLAAEASALENLASSDKESAALKQLAGSLTDSSHILGQMQFSDQPQPVISSSYSPEAAAKLSTAAAELSHSIPAQAAGDAVAGETMAHIAFQTNFDARQVLGAIDQKKSKTLPWPLGGSAKASSLPADSADLVACLPQRDMLSQKPSAIGAQDREAFFLARALDRGYALDYVLQLQAARGPHAAAAAIEAQRTTLNSQLRKLRSALSPECADIRLPAYQLPKDGLQNLDKVAAQASEDFAQALLGASGNLDGAAQGVVASVAFDTWEQRGPTGKPKDILQVANDK